MAALPNDAVQQVLAFVPPELRHLPRGACRRFRAVAVVGCTAAVRLAALPGEGGCAPPWMVAATTVRLHAGTEAERRELDPGAVGRCLWGLLPALRLVRALEVDSAGLLPRLCAPGAVPPELAVRVRCVSSVCGSLDQACAVAVFAAFPAVDHARVSLSGSGAELTDLLAAWTALEATRAGRSVLHLVQLGTNGAFAPGTEALRLLNTLPRVFIHWWRSEFGAVRDLGPNVHVSMKAARLVDAGAAICSDVFEYGGASLTLRGQAGVGALAALPAPSRADELTRLRLRFDDDPASPVALPASLPCLRFVRSADVPCALACAFLADGVAPCLESLRMRSPDGGDPAALVARALSLRRPVRVWFDALECAHMGPPPSALGAGRLVTTAANMAHHLLPGLLERGWSLRCVTSALVCAPTMVVCTDALVRALERAARLGDPARVWFHQAEWLEFGTTGSVRALCAAMPRAHRVDTRLGAEEVALEAAALLGRGLRKVRTAGGLSADQVAVLREHCPFADVR